MANRFVSRYLNVIDLETSCLLFNGATGALDEVTRELGAALRAADESFLNGLSEEERGFLLKRGHLTKLRSDEELERFRAYARALHEQGLKKARERSSLMLLMSYGCNLACPYCYQKMHRGGPAQPVMSEGLVDDIFGLHLRPLTSGQFSSICFYGGEPFLPAHAAVVKRALAHAKRLGLRATAVSNATEVHRMPEIFGPEPGKVGEIQVTLDGDRAAHDASRVTAAGAATFDRILDNIRLLVGRGVRIKLRINMDRERLGSLGGLLQVLKAKGILGDPLVAVYTHPVHSYIGGTESPEYLSARELSQAAGGLDGGLNHPIRRKAEALAYLLKHRKGAGLARTYFCMQTTQNCLIVDPRGDLYACYEEAGHPDLRVGRLTPQGPEFFPLRQRYEGRQVANMDKCAACSVALACGGGCPAQALQKNGNVFEPHCPGEKDDILESIRRLYLGQKTGDAAAAQAFLDAPQL